MSERYRVVQWATGNVGRRALPAILDHPEMDLVGLWVHSADKVGRDAGEIAGTGDVGVRATDNIEALLALHPDCVLYTPKKMNDDLVLRMLREGINVVTTYAGFLTATNLKPGRREAFESAAQLGRATLLGTGFDPGYINLLTGFLTGACRRVHSVHLTETLDCTTYPVAAAWTSTGFGAPMEDRESGPFTLSEGPSAVRPTPEVRGFFDTLDLIADMLEIQLDKKEWLVERAATKRDIDLGWIQFPAGSVAGQRRSYVGHAHGRPVIDLTVCWTMGCDDLDRDWSAPEGYRIEIEGEPRVEADIVFLPPRTEGLSAETDVMGALLVGTAMPAVHAIPFVCRAEAGITTPARLPLFGARHSLV